MTEQKPIKRILMLADFACATGFANIAHHIVAQLLLEKEIEYAIDIIGINYYGMPNDWQLNPNIRVFPARYVANGDFLGRKAFLEFLATGVYDIAFSVQDTFNIETIAQKMLDLRTEMVSNGAKPFKFIYYFPIDAKPKENWITKSVSLADIPVAYTQYAYDEAIKCDITIKNKLKIVPHGVNTQVFKPLPKEEVEKFKAKYFVGLAENKFLVTNVNRNQPRKDIARTMQIFKLFKEQCPDALLYLHMNRYDPSGYNIDEMARNFDLIPDQDYIVPKQFDEHDGLPAEVLNAIYNASDVIMTTTLGEGWGLSITEAMAAKTPVIAPNHTSLTEMIGNDKGTLVTAGKSVKDWYCMIGDNERMRPLVDIAEYVDKLVSIRNNYSDAMKKAETAYAYVTENLTWDKVGQQWRDIFKETIPSKKKQVVGRNDPCPCGSGLKYKKCHGKN